MISCDRALIPTAKKSLIVKLYMKFSLIPVLLYSSLCWGQLSDKEVLDLKSGRKKDDTSHVYWLPFENGKSYFLIQAANSKMSHKEELSLDFKMKKGSKICAAREGVVIDMRADSDEGGLKDENLSDGNFIIIQHADTSQSKYWHLEKNGVYVRVGDYVQKGQVIGKSGNTGFSAFPHLHFQVNDKTGKQVLTRFYTKNGVIYLRPGQWYKSIHIH